MIAAHRSGRWPRASNRASIAGPGAAISSKHTLSIINRGHGTAADVVQLAGYVQTRILSEFGVVLQPEPVLVGVEL